MATLHRYVLLELLRTFALAAVAMTALFTLAGGIYNVVRHEGVSAAQVFTVLPMLIPIVLTFTMPLAALFAATIVYGRLAADNELVACRAAGIDIRRLFRSALLLAIAVALCVFLLINYLMPGMFGQIRWFVRSNMRALAEQSLRTKGHIAFRRGDQYYVTAPYAIGHFDDDALRERGWDPDLEYLKVDSPTLLQLDEHGDVVRVAVGAAGWVQFDTNKDPVEVSAIISDARGFALDQHEVTVGYQPIGPIAVELPFPANPSYLSLNSLLRIQARPWEYINVDQALRRFVALLARERLAADCQRLIDAGEPLRLRQVNGRERVVSASSIDRDGKGDIVLRNCHVTWDEPDAARPSRVDAPQALLKLRGDLADRDHVTLSLEFVGHRTDPVTTSHPGSSVFGRPRATSAEPLRNLQAPEALFVELDALAPAQILDPQQELAIESADARQRRAGLIKQVADLSREIVSIHHFRFGFTVSTLITVLMGAAFGVIFRGSRVLAAFGLSAIPFGIAVMLVIMGRSTAEKPGTELLGALVIWGGLAGLALADAAIIRFGVRR